MELDGKKVTVVGMGRSGIAAARLLARQGACPYLTDSRDVEALREIIPSVEEEGFQWEAGGHTATAWEGTALVVLSPGVAPRDGSLDAAWNSGVEIISEMELAARFCPAKLIAVTGTNGKTTTTELICQMLQSARVSVGLAGNNATPLSEALLRAPVPEWLVLEVSSYALETAVSFHPAVSAVLNLTPDHLARHRTMEDYAAVKARIMANQVEGDTAILNRDDPRVSVMSVPEGVRDLSFTLDPTATSGVRMSDGTIYHDDEALAAQADIPMPGRHNLANVLAAIGCCRALGAPWPGCLAGLRSFRAVEHRLEHVARRDDGVDIYNDSKATNIDSLRVALESFERPVVLIAGGEGKGADYGPLAQLIHKRVKVLFTIGADSEKLHEAFSPHTNVVQSVDLDGATPKALAAATAGDVVLFSPGCASFDQYTNFEARGKHFKQLVARLLAVPTA